MHHVREEFSVIRRILDAVPDRRAALGVRAAVRDVENCLEDAVSILEAALKVICRMHLRNRGTSEEDTHTILEKQIRNRFQGVRSADAAFRDLFSKPLLVDFADSDVEFLSDVFEKRHPITHNLGVVDRKYLNRVKSGEFEGREVRVTAYEIVVSIDLCERMIAAAYRADTVASAKIDRLALTS
jgi:hypothetical protein